MKTLVTGGAGFIGSHLIRRLLERGEEVVVLDSLESQVHDGSPPALPDVIPVFRGDVGDATVLARAARDVDRVVHLAAAVGVGQSMYEIARYVRANTMATATMLEQLVERSSRPTKLVVASSMSIYGEGEYECVEHGTMAPPLRAAAQLSSHIWECRCASCGSELRPVGTRESKPLAPASVYAITKRDHEELCLVVGRAYGIPTVGLRFFNVYGPGQALSNPYTGVAAIFASRLLNRRPPLLYEDGRQTRDFIHVSDVVDAIVLALDSDCDGEVVNVGTGCPTAVGDVATLLAGSLEIDLVPETTDLYRVGDVRHCYADPARASSLLGFRARIGFEAGIKTFASWLADQKPRDRIDAAASELAARGLVR